MVDPSQEGPGESSARTRPERVDSVKIELPWVPLSFQQGAFLTQAVLPEYARLVEKVVELYYRCREQTLFDLRANADLTARFWGVLQAAHPHPIWRWGEWDDVYREFVQSALAFLWECYSADHGEWANPREAEGEPPRAVAGSVVEGQSEEARRSS